MGSPPEKRIMKLSLATRIFLGYAVVLLAFGVVSVFSVMELHQSQRELRLFGAEGYLRLIKDTSTLEALPDNEAHELDRIRTEPNPGTRRALIQLVRLFPERDIERLIETAKTARAMRASAPAAEQAFISEVITRTEGLAARSRDAEKQAAAVLAVLAQDQIDAGSLDARWQAYQERIQRVSRELRQLRPELEERVRLRVQDAQYRERRAGWVILGLSSLAVLLGLLATVISARALRPVQTLVEGVSRIGRGDYSTQLNIRGGDEIALLAHEFDAMARSLREREAQLKDKQEALLRAEQLAAVGRVSAQVAHEVRNPLSSIGLNVELLQESFLKAQFSSQGAKAEAQDVLASVLAEVDRLTEVTDQYLRMARTPNPHLAPEDVNAVVGSVLDFSREELERAQVKVVRALDPHIPLALADEGQLRQVFLNLVRNSREAMSGGGTLEVGSRASQGVVEVVFRDSGAGIPQEAQSRIFEPFFSTKAGGTGLGLALSRQILQAHGGSIGCENLEGGGTRFVIRLPVSEGRLG
jgi:signal transduction histidine kinase